MDIIKLSSENAAYELEKIGVCPAGVRVMKKKYSILPIKIFSVPVTEANIIKQEMLSIGGDSAQASGAINHSVSYTDVILLGTLSHYEKLLLKLKEQNFKALTELSDRLNDLLFSKTEIFRVGDKEYSVADKYVMGIINITPDSFYSDSRKDLSEVISCALKMKEQGADFIDIGAESTRPGAKKVEPKEEIKRLKQIIPELLTSVDIPVSIDTYKSDVAEFCLDNGVSIVNDISGGDFDDNMLKIISKYNATAVLMHIQGTPESMQKEPYYSDVIKEVYCSLYGKRQRALESGIDADRIILDTGIGFGKRLEDNYAILSRHKEFLSLKSPMLLGISRKSLIGNVLGNKPEDRLNGTTVLNTLGLLNGATILRVHDVLEAKEGIALLERCKDAERYGLY